MTGEEAVVLGFILVAFAIFGTTLAWVSLNSSNRAGDRLVRPPMAKQAG